METTEGKYAIADKDAWSSSDKDIYLWKVGDEGSVRLYNSCTEASQALVDYLAGPWAQSGAPTSVAYNDFILVKYDGDLTESQIKNVPFDGRVPRKNLVKQASVSSYVETYHIKPTSGAFVLPEGFGYAAVLKSEYNGAKLSGGGSVMLWITGPATKKRRVYPTAEEALECLQEYLDGDWDGEVAARKVTQTDFLIVKVQSPIGVMQPVAKSATLELAQILSQAQSFTDDDSLF